MMSSATAVEEFPAIEARQVSDKPKVKYSGRKAARAGSEQRRVAILEAALRIVVREGVRGIRHRSVAKEAEVPLAATTYYFKDIQELINDTFMLHAEKSQALVNAFARKLYEPLEGGSNPLGADFRAEILINIISEQMAGYVVDKTTVLRDSSIADQAFRYEAILNSSLRPLALSYQEQLESKIIEFLNLAKADRPREDAKALIATMQQLEYESLSKPVEAVSKREIFEILHAAVSKILG